MFSFPPPPAVGLQAMPDCFDILVFRPFLCNWRFVARNILNRIVSSGSYPTRPGIWYKFHADRPKPHLRTTPDSMSLRDRLNVRPRSREFIQARVLRLLWDTCCLHAEARVHRVATRGAAEAGSQGRDLEVTRSRPNCHLNTPQTRRRCLHTSSIKAHLPPCSPDAPEDPARVQPPEAEWI